MSKIALKPNDSGTGTFTLESPNSNTNRTLSLPDATGTVATVENLPAGYTDSDALDLFNATGSAPVYACRAWVTFDGKSTVGIINSGNVSSVTDDGTAQYTVNFLTNMPDDQYSVAAMIQSINSIYVASIRGGASSARAITAGSAPIEVRRTSDNNFSESNYVSVAIFR